MLLCKDTGRRAGTQPHCVLQFVCLRVHLDNHGHICAEVNASLGVPNEFGVGQLRIIIFVAGVLQSVGGGEGTTLRKVVRWVDEEVVERRSREDRELVLVRGVELRREELLGLAWQLSFWDYQLFGLFYVINADAEIWHATNHKKVTTISGKSHGDTLHSRVHWESVVDLQVRQAVDVHFWIEAVLSRRYDVFVVISSSHAIPVPLGPDVLLLPGLRVPKHYSISSNLHSSGLLTNGEVPSIVCKARFNTRAGNIKVSMHYSKISFASSFQNLKF